MLISLQNVTLLAVSGRLKAEKIISDDEVENEGVK